MSPLVSIIIPCKNAALWLGETIRSCLAQTWSSIEIIVIDNGSDDDSAAIARGFGDRVTLLACERPGAAAARNVGLARAGGKFIQFLDADDLLDPDKIAVQMARLETAPTGTIASGAWSRFRDDPSEAQFVAEPVWRDLAPGDFLISSWLGGGMMPNFAWLVPRTVIDRAGPWDETLSLLDDGEYFCRVVLASSGIAFCEGARGYYRTGSAATLSRRRDRAALESAYRSTAFSCDRLLALREPRAGAKNACATLWQRFIYDAFPLAPDLVVRAEAQVTALGGSDLRPGGGPTFRALALCFGWKAARRCQNAWRSLRRASTGRVTP
ncbi:MAG: glycosyltransferase family 2 protein [Stellaceae bacterium]